MARRKKRGRGPQSVPYARMRPLFDWVVGSQQLTNTGAVVGGFATPTAVATWNPGSASAPYVFTSGTPKTFMLCFINPVASGLGGANVQLGRLKVDEVLGRLAISTFSAAGSYDFAFGIYVSELTGQSSTWSVYDPNSPSDGARDDWYLLQARTITTAADGNYTATYETSIEVSLKESILIGSGQSLNLSVTMAGPSASTCVINPSIRTRVGPVA